VRDRATVLFICKHDFSFLVNPAIKMADVGQPGSRHAQNSNLLMEILIMVAKEIVIKNINKKYELIV